MNKFIIPQGGFTEVPKEYQRSPLRYPGGKTRAVKSLFSCIPEKETRLCAPFLGGASLELACTTKMHVHGSDVFKPLVSFWQILLTHQTELVERVKKYLPLTSTKFYNLQKSYWGMTDEIEMAAVFFVLNRSSFSGITFSGGMAPDHDRFTESAIQRLSAFAVQNLSLQCADFREVIPQHKDDFLYLDPPYPNSGFLYGYKGDTHKGFNHKALAQLLGKRDRWIMSYNDRPEIRSYYYKDNTIVTPEWTYGMAIDKQSNEILILSKDFKSDAINKIKKMLDERRRKKNAGGLISTIDNCSKQLNKPQLELFD